MGSDNELEAVCDNEGQDVDIKIDDLVEHLAQKAVQERLHPELMRASAQHFFTDLFNKIGQGDSEVARQGIEELSTKLEKRMLEIVETTSINVKDCKVAIDGKECEPYFDDGKDCR